MESPTALAGGDAGAEFAISFADVQRAAARLAGEAHRTPVLTCRTLDRLASLAAARAGALSDVEAAAIATSASGGMRDGGVAAAVAVALSASASASAASACRPSAPPVSLHFKCENLQRVGAFKFRGALNAVLAALERRAAAAEAATGDAAAASACPPPLTLVTHSSGNHAAALAHAAALCGQRSVIVMPSNAPAVKVDAVRGYGGEVVFCEPTQAAREAEAQRQLQLHAPHALLVPPYDHADVMAGQGTLALELLQQAAALDALVVPVGGGGMLAGVCVAAKAVNPQLRIYAAEPADADDAWHSLTSGVHTPLPAPTSTVADGLRTSLGQLTWPVLRAHVSGVVRVSEEEIVQAMRLVFERMKLVIEPSAGVGVAAALSERFWRADLPPSESRDNNPNVRGMVESSQRPIRRVGVVLCGGNVNLDQLPWNSTKGGH